MNRTAIAAALAAIVVACAGTDSSVLLCRPPDYMCSEEMAPETVPAHHLRGAMIFRMSQRNIGRIWYFEDSLTFSASHSRSSASVPLPGLEGDLVFISVDDPAFYRGRALQVHRWVVSGDTTTLQTTILQSDSARSVHGWKVMTSRVMQFNSAIPLPCRAGVVLVEDVADGVLSARLHGPDGALMLNSSRKRPTFTLAREWVEDADVLRASPGCNGGVLALRAGQWEYSAGASPQVLFPGDSADSWLAMPGDAIARVALNDDEATVDFLYPGKAGQPFTARTWRTPVSRGSSLIDAVGIFGLTVAFLVDEPHSAKVFVIGFREGFIRSFEAPSRASRMFLSDGAVHSESFLIQSRP